MVQIVLGVVTLVVLVAAFLASKRWHWGQVLALVAFYFASVGYLILAAQTVSARNALQRQVKQTEERFLRTDAELTAITTGTRNGAIVNRLRQELSLGDDVDELPSLSEIAHELRLKARARGRVWRNGFPAGPIDPATGVVQVEFPEASAAPADGAEAGFNGQDAGAAAAVPTASRLDLEVDSVVYVFESASESRPYYLGEFRVQDVGAESRTASLTALSQLALDSAALQRLQASRGPWAVYEVMPADRSGVLDGLTEEQLKSFLPAASAEEFLRDGTDWQTTDPIDRRVPLDANGEVASLNPEAEGVSYRYVRLRRDYSVILSDLGQRYAELYSLIQSSQVELEQLRSALAGAEEQQEFRQQQIDRLRSDLQGVERDREAILAHVEKLTSQIDRAERLLQATLDENAEMAERLASTRPTLVPVGNGALDIDAL
ncbi:MAG: hypothetical protein AAFV43_04160 [Planctomycetota bacterium]